MVARADNGMIGREGRSQRDPQMSPAPDSTLDDPQKIIADLQCANAELQRRLDERTDERDEGLQRETATAEVLQIINSSAGDLAPVFDAMLDKATRLCEADFGFLTTYQRDYRHQVVAMRNVPAQVARLVREPVLFGPETGMGRLTRGENLVHIPDLADDDGYRLGNPTRRAFVDLAGARTYVAVPL